VDELVGAIELEDEEINSEHEELEILPELVSDEEISESELNLEGLDL